MPRPKGTAKLAKRVGARVRQLRLEAGLTQEKLAWESDIAKPFLSQIEAGSRLPSIAVLKALADRLELTLADVIGFDLALLRPFPSERAV